MLAQNRRMLAKNLKITKEDVIRSYLSYELFVIRSCCSYELSLIRSYCSYELLFTAIASFVIHCHSSFELLIICCDRSDELFGIHWEGGLP